MNNLETLEAAEAAAIDAGAHFTIDTDKSAEWALKVIKQAQEERDRLLELVADEEERLKAKKAEIEKKCESETAYLKSLLFEFMKGQQTKQTKTQETYQLLTGKLVHKFGGTEYIRDDEKLLEWCKANDTELVKTKESVDWAKLKKTLVASEDGTVCTEYGEVIECIRAEKGNDKFEIKF